MINQVKAVINSMLPANGTNGKNFLPQYSDEYAAGYIAAVEKIQAEIERLEAIEAEKISYTRVNADSYGNPRYVISYFNLLTPYEQETLHYSEKYDYAAKRANRIGGSKYRGKDYGGGIVFQSYNMAKTIEDIKELLKEAKEKEPAPEAVK